MPDTTSPPRHLRGNRRPVRRGLAAAAALAVPAALAVGFAAPSQAVGVCSSSAPAAGATVTCTVAGSATIAVPAGSTSATVTVAGAGGGGGYGGSNPGDGDGGAGAQVTGTLDLTGLSTLAVVVGTGGAGRVDQTVMSTGGGYSALLNGSAPLVVAGGGGGGGAAFRGGDGAAASTAAGGDGAGDGMHAPGYGGAAGLGGAAAGGSGSTSGAVWSAGGAGGSTTRGGGGGAGYGGGGAGKGVIYESGGGAGGSYAAGGSVSAAAFTPAGGAGGAARAVGVQTGTSPGGATGAVTITFSGPAVTATAITPAQGGTAGGTTVTVTGGSFGSGTTVTIGGQPCTAVTVSSATSLTCTTPAHAAGAVDVVVTTGGHSATLAHAYAYVAAPGAPSGAVATAGTSSVAVSWTAPSSGGPVASYRVSSSQGAATCATTTTSCVLGATAGTAYDITVVAIGAGGESAGAHATSAVVPAPVVATSVPADALLTLTTDKGLITRAVVGQDIVVIGTGFAPYSTATIVVYSSPQVLGTVVTDGNGDFSKPVTVPGLTAGVHDLVAYGVDPQGGTRSLRMEVTVTAADGATLAATGFSARLPLALGALLLTAGTALAVVGRRRGART